MTVDHATRDKWDRAAAGFDLMGAYGPEWRWRPAKTRLFSCMRADSRVLFLALGTGLDVPCFPPGRRITAIDISPKMVEKAAARLAAYDGDITARIMDVHDMDFADASFDQVFTSCTFCSVPNPVRGLAALRRVLAPGGELHMFEHTGSRVFPFSVMMRLMNPLSRRFGPEITRDTVANVAAAGFEVVAVENVFLDMVKTIHARRPVRDA